MSWQAHGSCWHGHVTKKVRGFLSSDGKVFTPSISGTWTQEIAPEACAVCPPGKVLATYVQHDPPRASA